MIRVLLKMDFRLEATPENPFPRPATFYKLTHMPALPTVGMTVYIAFGLDSDGRIVSDIPREVDCVSYCEEDQAFTVRLSPMVVEEDEKTEAQALRECGWSDKMPELGIY